MCSQSVTDAAGPSGIRQDDDHGGPQQGGRVYMYAIQDVLVSDLCLGFHPVEGAKPTLENKDFGFIQNVKFVDCSSDKVSWAPCTRPRPHEKTWHIN
jgi:hypothetical protein